MLMPHRDYDFSKLVNLYPVEKFSLISTPEIIHKNKLCHSKTTVNWPFNDVWCYLVIGYFDQNIAIFQQTVIMIYLYL